MSESFLMWKASAQAIGCGNCGWIYDPAANDSLKEAFERHRCEEHPPYGAAPRCESERERLASLFPACMNVAVVRNGADRYILEFRGRTATEIERLAQLTRTNRGNLAWQSLCRHAD